MTIRQLQKVMDVNDNQYVKIHDTRTQRTIDSIEGWVFEPDYDYEGFNYDEVERIMNLKITAMEFSNDWLTIWAY